MQSPMERIDNISLQRFVAGVSFDRLRAVRCGSDRGLPVRVLFMVAAKAVREGCARLVCKKMLCALAMEGTFTSEGFVFYRLRRESFHESREETVAARRRSSGSELGLGQLGQERKDHRCGFTSEGPQRPPLFSDNKGCSLHACCSCNLHTDIAICDLTTQQNDAGSRNHAAPASIFSQKEIQLYATDPLPC